MNSETSYLREMCRPGAATPTMIVHAAWQLAHKESLQAKDLLAKFPELSAQIKAAAGRTFSDFTDETLGVTIGSDFSATIGSRFYIPRDFIQELCV